jgi:hypothetical protein
MLDIKVVYTEYGCSFCDKCLQCPLPKCWEEMSDKGRRFFLRTLDPEWQEAHRLDSIGITSSAIALTMHKSLRTIQRWLSDTIEIQDL